MAFEMGNVFSPGMLQMLRQKQEADRQGGFQAQKLNDDREASLRRDAFLREQLGASKAQFGQNLQFQRERAAEGSALAREQMDLSREESAFQRETRSDADAFSRALSLAELERNTNADEQRAEWQKGQLADKAVQRELTAEKNTLATQKAGVDAQLAVSKMLLNNARAVTEGERSGLIKRQAETLVAKLAGSHPDQTLDKQYKVATLDLANRTLAMRSRAEATNAAIKFMQAHVNDITGSLDMGRAKFFTRVKEKLDVLYGDLTRRVQEGDLSPEVANFFVAEVQRLSQGYVQAKSEGTKHVIPAGADPTKSGDVSAEDSIAALSASLGS